MPPSSVPAVATTSEAPIPSDLLPDRPPPVRTPSSFSLRRASAPVPQRHGLGNLQATVANGQRGRQSSPRFATPRTDLRRPSVSAQGVNTHRPGSNSASPERADSAGIDRASAGLSRLSQGKSRQSPLPPCSRVFRCRMCTLSHLHACELCTNVKVWVRCAVYCCVANLHVRP